jgi:hypothetical protein
MDPPTVARYPLRMQLPKPIAISVAACAFTGPVASAGIEAPRLDGSPSR